MLKSDFHFEVKEKPNDAGVFAGYGAVFGNVDLGRDVIQKGAFTETLGEWRAKGRMPKMLWHHNMRQPIGVWTDMNEDDYGLFVRGRFTKGVQAAEDVRLLLADDAIDGLSVGYDTIEDEYDRDLNVRKLQKVKLWEVSLVTLGMNPEALVTQKTADQIKTIRDFEDALRDQLGFSHAKAKAIASTGFKPAGDTAALDGLLASIRATKATLAA